MESVRYTQLNLKVHFENTGLTGALLLLHPQGWLSRRCDGRNSRTGVILQMRGEVEA